ncbi:MAG: hypothetical protein ABW184_14685 [Sphingobium sp.]
MYDRIFRLMTRRQSLDAQLRSEEQRGSPDIIRLLRLKRLSLIVRERLNRSYAPLLT